MRITQQILSRVFTLLMVQPQNTIHTMSITKEFFGLPSSLRIKSSNIFPKIILVLGLFLIQHNEMHSQDCGRFYTWQYPEETHVDSTSMPELIVVNEELVHILDSVATKIHNCPELTEPYRLDITHGWDHDTVVGDYEIYGISQVFFEDAEPKGIGYFYHRDILFVVRGESLPDCFIEGTSRKTFRTYSGAPPMVWEPVEWLYYKWDGRFYFVLYGCGICY